jgi:AI-2 transport protein TqsA
MGMRLNLSPLVVVVSVITWGWIWGVGGVLLAVPLTLIIKLGLERLGRPQVDRRADVRRRLNGR